jgi:hypothetical protein
VTPSLVYSHPPSEKDADYVWRRADDGADLMLRVTAFGLARIREAEGSVPAHPPAKPTIVAGADTNGTLAPQQPLVGDVAIGQLPANRGVTQAPPQPEAAPAAGKSSDAVQGTPAVSVRAVRQSRLRQAARALLAAWDASASADALDERFSVLRAALTLEGAASPST